MGYSETSSLSRKGIYFLGLTSILGPICFYANSYFGFYQSNELNQIRLVFFTPLAVTLLLLFLNNGSPKNWWREFAGITVSVNLEKVAVREAKGEDHFAIQQEIFDWVKDTTGSQWIKINPFTYKFLRKKDAVLFKLTWG